MKTAHIKKAAGVAQQTWPAAVLSSLAGVDLNLLVVLDAVLAERNVTRAARRLGVTQSALSHALSRLRTLLEDPLLVKTPGGMMPTALALELEAPLRSALFDLERTLRMRPRFDPATSRRQFAISSADYGMLVLLPELMQRVAAAAKEVSVIVQPTTTASPHELIAGQLDLIIGAVPPDVPDVVGRKLFDEKFVCLLRRDHPTVKDSLTVEQYAALPHVLISPMGRGATWVDPVLERLGMRRHIALRVPHFLVAPMIVAQTDMILTVAERIARTVGAGLAVRELPPPLPIPGFTVSMYWHVQRSEDPGHRWLREQVAGVAKDLAAKDSAQKVAAQKPKARRK